MGVEKIRRRVCDQERGRVVAMAAKTGGEEEAQELSVPSLLMPAQGI